MACVALASLMATIELEFLQPIPRVCLHDELAIKSFFEKLSSLQAFLEESSGGGATIKDLETKIRDFALKAEDKIEIQLSNFLQAKDEENQEEASQELRQTLQEAAESAAELLKIISRDKECDMERNVTYFALSSLLEKIELEFLQPIPKVSFEYKSAAMSLYRNLYYLLDFLEESSGGDAAIKDMETKIRDFALKAEEVIEIQLSNFLLAKDREYKENDSQGLHQTLREETEKAAKLLKIINSTSNEADEANETKPSIRWLKLVSEPENVKSDGSSRRSPKLKDRMVGRRHDYQVLKAWLLSDTSLRLISIVGMVGIGKTTLARSVYGDPEVASHFEVRVWITVHQEYNDSQKVSDPLWSITLAEPNEFKKESSSDELAEQLCRVSFGKRYLIVLDNLWNNRAWDDIRRCFPDMRNGSRILLTTRHFERNYHAGTSYYIYNLSLLDQDESWDLFCNILSLKECMAPKFEKIRTDVVEKCEGLPHSIVAVAERLCKCNNIEQDWKKIEKELESVGILDRSALTLSYNQLPQHLKVCFLYLGIFPKRSKIPVKMLIRLWSAEGFLNPWEPWEVESKAYGYLQDLIDRSLVLIDNKSNFDGKVKTCRMHSALHSFCVGEAQREGILCALNTRQLPLWSLNAFANSCRWLSLCTHSFDYYVLFCTNNPRSIFFFHENPEIFAPLKLLRVLAFVPSPFLQRVQMHVGNLIFLRYLSVIQWFEGLDYILSTTPNLQTLIVSGVEAQLGAPTLHLPSAIWEPPQLRNLELGSLYTVDPPSMVKEKLQTLSWVSPTHCTKKVYYRFPNIKTLNFFYKDDIEPSCTIGSCHNPIIFGNLDYLQELEKLTISVSVGCAVTPLGRSMFPLGLQKLRLSGTNLSETDLTVIGTLPRLQVLKLENAFHGKVWEVAKNGFRLLRFLLLEDKKLEQLRANKDSFPSLEHLVLRFCYCFEEIPRGFVEIPKLRSIELEQCRPSVVASAKQIQKEKQEKRKFFEIKIQGPDESQYTHIEDDLAGSQGITYH